MKKLLLFLASAFLLLSCGADSQDDNLESTAYFQSTVSVDDDVYTKGLNDTITISQSSYKECVESVNITPSTITHKTDNCVVSCKTKGTGSCIFDDSEFGIELYNSEGVHVGTVTWHEANSSNWKLHSCAGYNGYAVTCNLISAVDRNDKFEVKIAPDYSTEK
jgi:hypothetical protein